MRIIDYFDNGAKYYPGHTAFLDINQGEAATTYAEAHTASHRIAAAIRGHGYAKGAHIGILAPNSTMAFLALLGLFRAEGVWLPINPRNPVSINTDLLDRFDCELLFFHSSYSDEAEQIMAAVPAIRDAVCIDAATASRPSFEQWSAGCGNRHAIGLEEDGDLFGIMPTGGTTGKSKGVMITHRNIETSFANIYTHFRYYDNTRHLVVAPMTHSAGLTAMMHFARGGMTVIMSKTAPELIAEAMEKYRITHLFLPPTLVYVLLALPGIRSRDFRALQHVLVGAAPSSIEKLKEAIEVFGPVMSEAFGQTESPGTIAAKAPWDYLDSQGNVIESRLQSVGRPCVHNQVTLLDNDGNPVALGEPGEICVRGALVTPGYYKNPEATAEIRQFGWHHTGDIGVMDADGFLTIVDRKKDMIITGGFNVFPNEVEQVLMIHSAVQDCAVIGVPDEKWGEAIKAVVQLKAGANVDAEELISMVKTELGSVKAPKSVDFIDRLPCSPAGKVLKTELRKTYWEGCGRSVA